MNKIYNHCAVWASAVLKSSKMSKVKFKQQNNDTEGKNEEVEFDLSDIRKEVVDLDGLEEVLQKDANIFLMNNLLISVQFFENYERDIKVLRENWFKDYSLKNHHKKCFYADGLLSLSRGNVKLTFQEGDNKKSESQLLPLCAYISSDNVEAAFDPSVFGYYKSDIWPQYQLTVKTNSKTQKSGCISLVEYQTLEGPDSHLKGQNDRKIPKMKPSIGFGKIFEKRGSLRFSMNSDDVIPVNGFYKFENQEEWLKPTVIQDLKMNSAPKNSHEIPHRCFQYEEVRNELHSRRAAINKCFKTQKILNSAAFKGYFCDLLIERLAESLNLDVDALNNSVFHEEFIVVNQKGIQYSITPIITIKDWNKFIPIRRFLNTRGKLLWPTAQMQELLNALPCSVVPTCHFRPEKECLDYEKTWKIVFPKQEEFLLLHMMHAHVRCYFFSLLLYKSFIEKEINTASFGPKHIMHLLFWKVHKNFLAWPDDRPAEVLLIFLNAIYKKLQNKCLPDFFMPSRNLLASSHPKDLHKAQTFIKKITENPIPYLIRALSQLTFDQNFYPTFDFLKLHTVLTAVKTPEKRKKVITNKKKVQFSDDKERLWKKNVIKQIELERKAEEEQTSKLSVETIITQEILNFNSDDFGKRDEILEMFVFHFIQMGTNSIELNCLSQAIFYLNQTQKLFQLLTLGGATQSSKEIRDQIQRLKQDCYRKIRQELEKSPKKQFQSPEKTRKTETKEQIIEEEIIQEEEIIRKEEVIQEEEIIRKEEVIQEEEIIRKEEVIQKEEIIQEDENLISNEIVVIKL